MDHRKGNQNWSAFPLQLQLLSTVQNIISNEKYIAAALLGSFASGAPDRVSDLDILIWISSDDIDVAKLELFGIRPFDVIHAWEQTPTPNHTFKKTIYCNFVSTEIHVLTPESSFKLRRPYYVLKDSNSFLDSRTEPGDRPKHEEFDALGAGLDGLGWELFEMFKWWTRGKKRLVLDHLIKLTQKLNETESN